MRPVRHALLLSALLGLCGAAASALRADDAPPAPAPAAPAAPAPAAPDEAQILRWVAELGGDDFRARERASAQLEAAGEAARPALEEAARTSDSLEVRWRAQQILMRLKGQKEQALDPSERAPAPRLRPSLGEALRRWLEKDDSTAWRETIERFWREFERDMATPLPGSPRAGGMPFGLLGESLTAGALTLEAPLLGRGGVRLRVRSDDGSERVLEGATLEAIVQAHPEVGEHKDIAALRAQLDERKRSPLHAWRLLGPGTGGTFEFSFQSSQGIEVRQDASGALVRIRTEPSAGAAPTWVELRGASIEEIKQQHPEYAKRIDAAVGGMRIRIGPPRVVRGPDREGLGALDEPAPEAHAPPAPRRDARFGVGLLVLEPALALQLSLAEDEGVLVEAVEPGSQAARMGLVRYDVITAIDGRPVKGLDAAAQALRAAARSEGALTIEVVRQGQRKTLTR